MIKLTFGLPISPEDFRKIAYWLIPEYAKLPTPSLGLLEEEISTILAHKHALEITKDETGQYYLHNLFTLNLKPQAIYRYKVIETVVGRQLTPGPITLPPDPLID